jgi:alkylation response protein AidB-like acyl-CoA dehydrogenase
MTLCLTPEAELVRDIAREFFLERSPVRALRSLRDSGTSDGYDPILWRSMSDLGWAGFLVPENLGGSEFGVRGLMAVIEAAARTLAPTPLFATALLGATALMLGGSEAQRSEHLPALAAGERLIALAVEETVHHASDQIKLSASHMDDGWRLSGTKVFVMDGGIADMLIVVARSQDEDEGTGQFRLFLVPVNAPGVHITRHRMVDSRSAATIAFDNVHVHGTAELRGSIDGADLLARLMDMAYLGMAAESLGVAEEAFERTITYLKERNQFGVPIGSFQSLKHRAALMFCEIELLRSALLGAIEAVELGATGMSALASVAKAKAADTLFLVSNECIQMHGGIGMTDEHEIGFFFKRARVIQLAFGGATFHRDRHARIAGY